MFCYRAECFVIVECFLASNLLQHAVPVFTKKQVWLPRYKARHGECFDVSRPDDQLNTQFLRSVWGFSPIKNLLGRSEMRTP